MIDIDWDMYPRAAKKHQRADWLSAAVYTIILGSAYNKEDNKMEEKNVTEAKDIKGKTRLDLVLPSAIEWLGRIRTYGVQKYKDPDNWKKVPKEQYIAAAMRHFEKYRAGSYFDEESGMPHLAHAMCNIMFLLDMEDDERTAKCNGSWCDTCDGSCGCMCKYYSANEFRRILGMKPLDDPAAEELGDKDLSDTCDGFCGCKDDTTNVGSMCKYCDKCIHYYSSFDVVYNKYNKRCSLRIDTSSHLLKDDGTCDCFSARDDLYLPEELKHCSEI